MAATASPKQRLLTIGTVCGMLKEEFLALVEEIVAGAEDEALA